MTQKHSTLRDGKRLVWYTERLWTLAEGLAPFDKPVSEIAEVERDCWFAGKYAPTIRAIADHCRRIEAADLDRPIILNSDGSLMDGGHRLAKAILEGKESVRAVQFVAMPEPDEIRAE